MNYLVVKKGCKFLKKVLRFYFLKYAFSKAITIPAVAAS